LELTQDAVAVKRKVQLSAHLVPSCDFLMLDMQSFAQLAASLRGERCEQIERAGQAPRRHYVRIGVVVHAWFVAVWITVVVFVRSHHVTDIIAAAATVPSGDARPKAGDLEEELGSVQVKELGVARGLIVLPDVVGNSGAGVPLAVRVIPYPVPGAGIEKRDIGLFPPVAAALPREHRASISGRTSRPARLWQTAIAVEKDRASQDRRAEAEERKDEELVPKDVATVSFTVPAARRNTGVELHRMQRDGLQQVKHVEADDQTGVVERVGVDRDEAQIAARPYVAPSQGVSREKIVERAGPLKGPPRFGSAVRGRTIARGMECDNFLELDMLAGEHFESDFLPDTFRLLHHMPLECAALPIDRDPEAGRLSDPQQ